MLQTRSVLLAVVDWALEQHELKAKVERSKKPAARLLLLIPSSCCSLRFEQQELKPLTEHVEWLPSGLFCYFASLF